MNKVGEVFEPEKIGCREMNIPELAKVVTSRYMIRAACWAYRNPTIYIKNRCFRFRVSGHHHRGYVYIMLNGADLFDVYYTNIKNVIKKIDSDVYGEDLVDTLDNTIERLPSYVN